METLTSTALGELPSQLLAALYPVHPSCIPKRQQVLLVGGTIKCRQGVQGKGSQVGVPHRTLSYCQAHGITLRVCVSRKQPAHKEYVVATANTATMADTGFNALAMNVQRDAVVALQRRGPPGIQWLACVLSGGAQASEPANADTGRWVGVGGGGVREGIQ